MRPLLRHAALGAVVMLLLGGCSLFQPKGDALGKRVDELVAEKRYGKAQELLNNIPPDSPDFKRFAGKRKQVNAQAAQYERKVVDEAHQLILKEQWAAALDLYDEALERLPESAKLQSGLTDLNNLQRQRIEGQERELLINKGARLMDELPTYRRMAQIDPRDRSLKRQYEDMQEEAEETAATLIEIGQEAMATGDYELADRTIPLAARLSEKPEAGYALRSLEQGRSKRNERLRNLRDKRQRDEAMRDPERPDTIVRLQRDYEDAVKERDYVSARILLKRLRIYAPEIVAERGYERDLQQRIEVESERLYNEGVSHYGHSQFEKARDAWTTVLQLVPGHVKAKESLARVEKVLNKVQHLRKKQQGG